MVPTDRRDLADGNRAIGFENLDFRWSEIVATMFDGRCMITRRLPAYPITGINTGQWSQNEDGQGAADLWRVDLSFRDD